jgi:Zn-dependent M28 family amino/carboxypeptidase
VLEEALRRHVDKLTVEIGPRAPGLGDSLARTAAYIRSEFEAAGLSVTEQPYDFLGHEVANLIAAPPAVATAPAFYVVGAHYDSVPGTPGADDNASAVAVLLELARRLPETGLPAPVRLVAFTMEESPAFTTGLQGSRMFVRACRAAGERVAGAIVLEMVGYTAPRQIYPPVLRFAGYPSRGDFIGIVGNWRSRPFGRAMLRGFRRNEGLPVESLFVPFDGRVLPATRESDHSSFWDAGLPALMVTDTAFFRNPHYHLPTDTAETLDYAFMAELVGSLRLALQELPPIPSG